MITLQQLARMTLHYRTLTNAKHAMADYAAAINHLKALGLTDKESHAHPVAVLLADRISLLTRMDSVSEKEALNAYEHVRQLAEGI